MWYTKGICLFYVAMLFPGKTHNSCTYLFVRVHVNSWTFVESRLGAPDYHWLCLFVTLRCSWWIVSVIMEMCWLHLCALSVDHPQNFPLPSTPLWDCCLICPVNLAPSLKGCSDIWSFCTPEFIPCLYYHIKTPNCFIVTYKTQIISLHVIPFSYFFISLLLQEVFCHHNGHINILHPARSFSKITFSYLSLIHLETSHLYGCSKCSTQWTARALSLPQKTAQSVLLKLLSDRLINQPWCRLSYRISPAVHGSGRVLRRAVWTHSELQRAC